MPHQQPSARRAGANLTGSLLGSRAAVRLMRAQPAAPRPAYHIFNMGFSGWGARLSRTAATHKSSKTGLTALTAALAQELRAAGAPRSRACTPRSLPGRGSCARALARPAPSGVQRSACRVLCTLGRTSADSYGNV